MGKNADLYFSVHTGDKVSQSAQAAIKKYHRLGDLHSKNLFLTVLEAEKSKIKVW